MENIEETKSLPKLVGTNFVKIFRKYLISQVEENNLTENDLVRKAFLDKNVKPDTTRKYINEMIKLEIFEKNNEEKLKLV